MIRSLAAALLAATAAHAECRLARVAELPLTIERGHLLVDGKVNGHAARMIFDTGAADTTFTEAAVGKLDLRPMRSEEHALARLAAAEGIGGEAELRPVVAQHLDFGGLRARDYAVWATNTRLGGTQPPPDGLLSLDVLAKYDIDLDFPGGHIRLFYPRGDCTHPSAFLNGDLYPVPMLPGSADNSPPITVTVGNQTLTAMVDTGAPGSVLFRNAAARLGLTPFPPALPRIADSGIGHGKTAGTVQTIATIGIGDLEFKNVPMFVADTAIGSVEHPTDMLLGMDFLRRLHPWISFSSNTLILQYPPAPSPTN